MTTTFNALVSMPWERPEWDTSSGIQAGGRGARIADGIALFAWGERTYKPAPVGGPTSAWSYYGVPHLAAVRHTDEGPVVGPVTLLTPPTDYSWFVEAVLPDPAGGCWIFMSSMKIVFAGTTAVQRVAKVTVDPTTLALTVSWRFDLPRSTSTNPWVVTIAPDLGVFVAAVYGSTTSEAATGFFIINMSTGVVTSRALPLGSGATRPTYPFIVSYHPERKEVLLLGDRVTGGYDRPTLWTVPITASSIGSFVMRTNITTVRFNENPPTPYPNDDISTEGGMAVPRSGGWWEIVASFYPGDGIARHFFFTPGSPLDERAMANAPAPVYWNAWVGSYGSNGGISHEAGVTSVGLTEMSDRTATVAATGLVGGVRHLEFTGDVDPPSLDVRLPESWNVMQYSGSTLIHVPVGDGRFLYLFGGAAITKPWINNGRSWEFVTYAGGPNMAIPFVPGIKGERPEENRSAFRRVN